LSDFEGGFGRGGESARAEISETLFLRIPIVRRINIDHAQRRRAVTDRDAVTLISLAERDFAFPIIAARTRAADPGKAHPARLGFRIQENRRQGQGRARRKRERLLREGLRTGKIALRACLPEKALASEVERIDDFGESVIDENDARAGGGAEVRLILRAGLAAPSAR
jgi:hypothetical protein